MKEVMRLRAYQESRFNEYEGGCGIADSRVKAWQFLLSVDSSPLLLLLRRSALHQIRPRIPRLPVISIPPRSIRSGVGSDPQVRVVDSENGTLTP